MEKRTAIFPKLPGILLFLRQLDLLRNADHFVCFLRKKNRKNTQRKGEARAGEGVPVLSYSLSLDFTVLIILSFQSQGRL